MFRVIMWIFLLLLAAIGVWGYFFLVAAGVFLDIPEKSVGQCTQVTAGGIAGVEDLAIDGETGTAFLAGYNRWTNMKQPGVRGAIWTYTAGATEQVPVDATKDALPQGFQPHGISLHREPDGRKVLFVINHAGGRHSVEIFDVNGAALVHRRTVTGVAMVSPNDIVGTGTDSFYVTNDHANTTGWMRTVEDFGRLRLTTVQYFDGKGFTTALEGLGGSNGINISADGRSLYVAAASERAVYVYDRDPGTGTLGQRTVVYVPGFADNIDVLANGDLLLGLHTKILDLLGHFQDRTKLSPSHVMLLRADGKGGFVPETIYYNKGEEISGVSVAAAAKGRLLIGPIFQSKILDCPWAQGQ
jgi:arylesterase/paraoxonase